MYFCKKQNGCCWVIVSHGSLTFLHVLWAEALIVLVPAPLFRDICIVNGLGKCKYYFLGQKNRFICCQLWKILEAPVAQEVKDLPAVQEMLRQEFNPYIGKIPWRRKWQPTPIFLPGKSHGQRSLAGNSPWGCKRVWRDWAHTCDERYERFRVPLLSCKPVLVQMLSGPFPVILWELWDSGNQCKNVLILWLAVLAWVVNFFVSYSGVSRFVPSFMNPWQAYRLICKA